MHIEKVKPKIGEIARLWAIICKNTISPKVATLREQNEMQERINAVVERYKQAIESGVEYMPVIRKELNQIKFTLQRWLDYNEIVYEKAIKRISKILR